MFAHVAPQSGLDRPQAAQSAQRDWLFPVDSFIVLISAIVVLSTFRELLSVDDLEGGNRNFQAITLTICILGFLSALKGLPTWLPRLIVGGIPILISVIYIALSSTWSVDPASTFRRALALVLSTGFTFYIVARLDLARFSAVLFVAFAIFIVASYVALLFPSYGITQKGILAGTWRGFTGHKNELGRICGLGLGLLAVSSTFGHTYWRKWRWFVAIGLGFLLIQSDSKTPLIAAIGATALAFSARFLAQGNLGRVHFSGSLRFLMAILALIVALTVVPAVLPYVFELLGRDATLSGRENVWEFVWSYAGENTLFGAGYRAFWTDTIRIYYQEFFWWILNAKVPSHSHNSYIDTWVELGVIGLIILGMLLLMATTVAWRCLRRGHDAEGMLLTLLLSFICVYGLTERVFFQHFESLWFLFTVSYLYGVRALIRGPDQAALALR